MYQALYRKYRPRVFADVVGQEHVTRTLMNEIKTGRTSHAYLFTGSRGTGKTTCAKIFAKAVNCEHPHDGDPCNECEICRGIDNGSVMDVVEIDAASNNGVDSIRDIRDEANFTPANGKYRVYIIDEVHMLSIGAFNALLKTLEEPPEHVKFILATTEVHKLPATILSRCQRFDFKRISPEDIAGRVLYVADKEGLEVTQDAANLIARLADGALRDALSILDQCMGHGKQIDEAVVNEVVGLTGKQHLFDLADAIIRHDSASALDQINELHNNSIDMERLCGELINHFRNLMVCRAVSDPQNLIVCSPQELQEYQAAAQQCSMPDIMNALNVLGDTLTYIRKGLNRRVEMEMAVIRLCNGEVEQPAVTREAAAQPARASRQTSQSVRQSTSVLRSAQMARRDSSKARQTQTATRGSAHAAYKQESVSPPPVKSQETYKAENPESVFPPLKDPQEAQSAYEPEPVPPPLEETQAAQPAYEPEPVPPPLEESQAAQPAYEPDPVPPPLEEPLESQTVYEPEPLEPPAGNKPAPEDHPFDEPAPTTSSTSSGGGDILSSKTWRSLLNELARQGDPVLLGCGQAAQAAQRGETLEIVPNSPTFADMLKRPEHQKAIRKATNAIFGVSLEPRVVTSLQTEPIKQEEKTQIEDPLQSFLSKAKALGVPVDIKE